jgi:hypothetical protein
MEIQWKESSLINTGWVKYSESFYSVDEFVSELKP